MSIISMDRATYYVRPNILISILVVFGLWLTCCTCLAPHTVPYNHMSIVGTLYKHIAFDANPVWKWVIFVGATLTHVGESLYSLYLTKQKGITDPATRFKWCISTFALGIFSLRHLLNLDYKKD